MPLRPEIKAKIEADIAAGAPQVWEVPVEITRKNTLTRVAFSGKPEPIHSIVDRFIPGPTSYLHIRIYRPSHDKNIPAIVFYHGGGWVLNFLEIFDASLVRLANQSGACIIAVSYQKAPEHPFPIPFNDCYATLLWVRENYQELGVDLNNIGVLGDSAGGNLAAAVALKARDNGVPLKFQGLIYPCVDRNFTTRSYIEYATGFGLSTQTMQWFWDQYLQGSSHDKNPYAVPASAKDFKGVAPAIVLAAEYDPLESDAENYTQLLKEAGVPTTFKLFEGVNHGFTVNFAQTPVAQESMDYLANEIKKITR